MYLEVRNAVAGAILRELLGADWRPDRPIETLGGLLGQMASGTPPTYEAYKKLVGKIEGLRDGLALLDETIKQLGDGKL